MKLSKKQLEIVNSPEDKIVVMSAAASGKTRCLIERVRYMIKQGIDVSKIVCITFTNNAADEIKERLKDDYKEGMFIGTIHSYANLLLNKGGIDTGYLLSSEKFDDLFELIEENPQVIDEVEFLALDEAQDSTPKQFNFIFDIIDPAKFAVFGDIRQSIYGFNHANPKLMISLGKRFDVVQYELNENYRNGVDIVKFSSNILAEMKNMELEEVVCMKEDTGYLEKIRLRDIARILYPPYKDWVILCRFNSTVSEIIFQLNRQDIPTVTFKQAQQGNKELQQKINKDAVKVLTIHSSKGLEFPNVIVAETFTRNEEDKRLMYVAATRAMDQLYWVKGR